MGKISILIGCQIFFTGLLNPFSLIACSLNDYLGSAKVMDGKTVANETREEIAVEI